MEKSVQQQITDAYAALARLMNQPGAAPRDLAAAYGTVGNLLLAADYYDAAEPFYLHAESLQPNDIRWPYYLGHDYLARSELTKAAEAFQRALRQRPDDVATLVWLGNVYLDQGHPEMAEPLFTQALSRDPRTVAALYGLGQSALAQRDYSRAIERFEQVLAADPRASIAHYPLALAYRGVGQAAKAEAHLQQQGPVEVGPPDPLMNELRTLLRGAAAEEDGGRRAMNAGDYRSATSHYRAAIELAPDNPTLHLGLGTALSLGGDTAGAIEQFREALRLSPHFGQAHFSLGVLLAATGQMTQAQQELAAAMRDEPDFAPARLQYAIALAQTGNLRDARRVLADGVKLYPNEPRFAEMLARVDGVASERR